VETFSNGSLQPQNLLRAESHDPRSGAINFAQRKRDPMLLALYSTCL